MSETKNREAYADENTLVKVAETEIDGVKIEKFLYHRDRAHGFLSTRVGPYKLNVFRKPFGFFPLVTADNSSEEDFEVPMICIKHDVDTVNKKVGIRFIVTLAKGSPVDPDTHLRFIEYHKQANEAMRVFQRIIPEMEKLAQNENGDMCIPVETRTEAAV